MVSDLFSVELRAVVVVVAFDWCYCKAVVALKGLDLLESCDVEFWFLRR